VVTFKQVTYIIYYIITRCKIKVFPNNFPLTGNYIYTSFYDSYTINNTILRIISKHFNNNYILFSVTNGNHIHIQRNIWFLFSETKFPKKPIYKIWFFKPLPVALRSLEESPFKMSSSYVFSFLRNNPYFIFYIFR